jgi:PhzF family phenazine biosynthesis protein
MITVSRARLALGRHNRSMQRPFRQVDVFTTQPYRGNPVAVVLDADGLPDATMQRFAAWTNLSEATFVLPPTRPDADYRVRIFEPTREMPFAGHPSLGTCHAWLETGGRPRRPDRIVQECGVGLVTISRGPDGLAFAAPPLIRSGPVDDDTLDRIARGLRCDRSLFVDARWADNGSGWVAVLLPDADAVLGLRPGVVDLDIGVVGFHPRGGPAALEVRAFFPNGATTVEDPVTGSLNAALAGWLIETGRIDAPYLARQGTALGREGRVRISRDPEGTIWVGGNAVTCVSGRVDL